MKDLAKYTIKNLNREKLFKELTQITTLKDIRFEENTLHFSVAHKQAKRVEKKLAEKGVTVLNKRRTGLFAFYKKTILRMGVIIPILFLMAFAFVCNFFVFDYQILGTELIENSQVLEILEQENISGIVSKGKIDTQSLEHKIQKLDKVSLVSVIVRGNTLVVNIKEKVYNEEYEDKDSFKPLCSTFDGTITDITVVSGTPLVKAGQTVKAGQELVAPYVIDTSGNKKNIKPMADIKADVFLVTSICEPDEKILHTDTGSCYTQKIVTMFGATIYNSGQKQEYKTFRTESETLPILKNVILPIKVTYVKYYEQQIETHKDYYNSKRELIIEDCKQKTRQKLDLCDIIKDEYYYESKTAGLNRLTYTIVVNKSIC